MAIMFFVRSKQFGLFVNDYGYDSCKSDVMLFVMVIELPRPTS